MRLLVLACAAVLLSPLTPVAAQGYLPKPGEPATATLPAPLERVLRDYERGWRAGDARAVAALFAE
ncbi:MAG TPA: hypothetical protein VFV33_20570, partial [Gemmatimonadaceae bacterium]|nr:hypothetical protein [Gemmatimonadaceae bacterium]